MRMTSSFTLISPLSRRENIYLREKIKIKLKSNKNTITMAIKLEDLTQEERDKLFQEEIAKRQAEEAKKKEDTISYKQIVDETIQRNITLAKTASKTLREIKEAIYNDFAIVVDLKEGLYPKTEKNNSHSFTTKDGQFRIKIGTRMLDNYDDTVEDGISIIKQHISAMGKDEDSKKLSSAVLQLLSKNKTGSLKASRVIQLEQLAKESNDEVLLEGVEIIKDAYHPLESKQFIEAYYKGEKNEWIAIPLSMTEV